MAVPQTVIALLLFLALLVPGFIASLVGERNRARQQRSPFREMISIACISFAADTAALLIFAVVRIIWPSATPDMGALVRQPNAYVTRHYAAVGWWSLAILCIAATLASISATGTTRRGLGRIPITKKILPPMHPSTVSGWWLLFTEHPAARMHVGCVLDDGSYIAGWLKSYSNTADDSADRDLLLTAPIRYRAPEGEEEVILPDVGAVSVSARNIVVLTVSYLSAEDAERADARDMANATPSVSRSQKFQVRRHRRTT